MPYDELFGMHWGDDPDCDDTELDDDFWHDYESQFMESDLPECVMCDKERHWNSDGYCGQCWVIWNS